MSDDRPYVTARDEAGKVHLKLNYPHKEDEPGDIIRVELSMRELESVFSACMRAILYWVRQFT